MLCAAGVEVGVPVGGRGQRCLSEASCSGDRVSGLRTLACSLLPRRAGLFIAFQLAAVEVLLGLLSGLSVLFLCGC
jgi:hypothetical protein